MDYREWDPLQLSSEIDNGARVVKQSVSFDLFRTYRHKISWNPIAYQNFGIFYGGLEQQKQSVIESIAKRSMKFAPSINISLFTFENNKNIEIWDNLEKEYNSFFHHPFNDTFEFFLKELQNLRNDVEEKTTVKKMIEPSNKVLQLVLLDLYDEQLRLLKIPENLKLFQNLLTNSYYQRIYIGFFIKEAESVPLDIHSSLDFSAYLGTLNDEYCRSVYKGFQENEYSRKQVLIGTGFIRSSQTLVNLHPVKFTPNESFIKAQQHFDKEDEAYMNFLNSLDDGTIEDEK